MLDTAADVRVALGAALRGRARKSAEMVVEACRPARGGPERRTAAAADAHVLFTCELATDLIGRWVMTGQGASAEESEVLAKGGVLAADGTVHILDICRSYLSWRDCASAVLAEVGAEVGAPVALIQEVTSMIGRSCDASLMTMVRGFGARYYALQDSLAQEHAALSHLATHDSLTGLVNRTYFLGRLEQALAAATRADVTVAVFFLDLDGFKAVNDQRGHDAGDRLLQAVAQRLHAQMRPGDTVARFGGDEFVILCPDLPTREAAYTVRDRLQRNLSEPFTIPDELTVRISIGLALAAPGDGSTQLLNQADAAMYTDKAAVSGVSGPTGAVGVKAGTMVE